MVGFDRGDGHAIFVVDHSCPARWHFARLYEVGRVGGHDRSFEAQQALAVAVLGVAALAVEAAGGIEATNDLIEPDWAIDLERHMAPLCPTLHVQFTQFADVVRIEVGQEHRLDLWRRDAPECQVLRKFGSDIGHEQLTSRDQRSAGLGRLMERERAGRSADLGLQRIVPGWPVGLATCIQPP